MFLQSMLKYVFLCEVALGGFAACGDNTAPAQVAITTELTTRWDLLSHRISVLEIGFTPDGTAGGALVGQNDGGTFGSFDKAFVREAFTVYRSAALIAVPLSIEVELAAPGSVDPEAFVATGQARGAAGALAGADAMIAVLRGYRISSDEYDTRPAFESDIPYNPRDGYTTQGIGLQLGEPRFEGDEVVVPVSARVSLGPSDRADMNAAMPQASSWVRVDVLVIGTPRIASHAARGEAAYTLSTTTYGKDSVHLHADPAVQAATVEGEPALAGGLLGLSGFDFWLNAPNRIDPACVVVEDEINSMGEMVSGPGRYLRELSVRLGGARYDAAQGRADADLDLYMSNSSVFYEEGNMCLGVRGEISLLQFDAAVETIELAPVEVELEQGIPVESAITFD